MRYAARKDSNHNAIANAATKLGASVFDTSRLGDDFPDMVIGYRGHTIIVELKTATGKLSAGQKYLAETWKGSPIRVWRTIDDVIADLTSL